MCLLVYIYRGINPLKMQLKSALKNKNIENNLKFKSNIFNLLYPPIRKKSTVIIIPKVSKRNVKKIINKKKFDLNSNKSVYNKLQIYSNSGSKNNVLNKNYS